MQRFRCSFKQYHGRSSSLGASLEPYLIVAAVLIGEAENRLFTARQLSSYLAGARTSAEVKHLETVGAVEALGANFLYRLVMFCAKSRALDGHD